MTPATIDASVHVETPEGIQLELRPAGLQARSAAWLIDAVIRYGIYLTLVTLLTALGRIGVGALLVSLFLIEWLYPVAFELSKLGGTPGKRVMGLRVVLDDGMPVTPAASVARNLMRAADFLPFCYAAGIMSVLWRADFKRLGDVVAGTLVVHEKRHLDAAYLPDVEAVAPARSLSRPARVALMGLAARARRITPQRLDEVAALAAPACGMDAQPSPRLTRQVLGVGRWLLGQR